MQLMTAGHQISFVQLASAFSTFSESEPHSGNSTADSDSELDEQHLRHEMNFTFEVQAQVQILRSCCRFECAAALRQADTGEGLLVESVLRC